jgi:hypothetical protein
LKEIENNKFLDAMAKEIQLTDRKNMELIRRSEIPNNIKVLPSVWAMRRKRDLTTGENIKWKARLNVDGSKQQYGIYYGETHAPVASWSSI